LLSTKEALEADGYEVQEAVDGAAAIELLDDPSL
jgi:CheY-like chemotaxis protein